MCIVGEDEDYRFLFGVMEFLEEELRQRGGPRVCCFAMLYPDCRYRRRCTFTVTLGR